MTAATAEAPRPAVIEESLATKILRVLGKAPVHILLVVIGLLWLVPTIGLFITSLLAPEDFQEKGWWQIFSEPGNLTFSNYEAVFDNDALMEALDHDRAHRGGGNRAPHPHRGLRRLRVRLARVPGPRLDLHPRDRAAGRAASRWR